MKDIDFEYKRALHMIEMELYEDANKILEEIKDESLDAYIELAYSYDVGRGVPQNEDLAFRMYKAKLDSNHPRLLTNLASYCAENDVMSDSFERAEEYYQRAIAQENEKVYVALYGIGLLYINRQYKYFGNKTKEQLNEEGLAYIEQSASYDYLPAIKWLIDYYSPEKYNNKEKYIEFRRKLFNLYLSGKLDKINPLEISPNYKMSCKYLKEIFLSDNFNFDDYYNNLELLDELMYSIFLKVIEELKVEKGKDKNFDDCVIITNSLSYKKFESNEKKIIVIELKKPEYECECNYVILEKNNDNKKYFTSEYYITNDSCFLCEFTKKIHYAYVYEINTIDDITDYFFKDIEFKSGTTSEEDFYYSLRSNISDTDEIVTLFVDDKGMKFIKIKIEDVTSIKKNLNNWDRNVSVFDKDGKKYYKLDGLNGFLLFKSKEHIDLNSYRNASISDKKVAEYIINNHE